MHIKIIWGAIPKQILLGAPPTVESEVLTNMYILKKLPNQLWCVFLVKKVRIYNKKRQSYVIF